MADTKPIKLINRRGRPVNVPAHEVQMMRKRGFVNVPADQPNLTYYPVYDRGDKVKEPYVEKERKTKRQIVRLGDSLRVEKV